MFHLNKITDTERCGSPLCFCESEDEAEAVAEEEEEAAAESAPAESAQDASEAWIDKGRWVVRGIYAEHLRLLNYLVLLLPKVGDRSPAEEDEVPQAATAAHAPHFYD